MEEQKRTEYTARNVFCYWSSRNKYTDAACISLALVATWKFLAFEWHQLIFAHETSKASTTHWICCCAGRSYGWTFLHLSYDSQHRMSLYTHSRQVRPQRNVVVRRMSPSLREYLFT